LSVGRVLIIGSNGLLGQKIVELFVRGSNTTLTTASIEPESVMDLQSVQYHPLDITVRKDVKSIVARCEPQVIINCAALTNVDACEKDRESAWKVNVTGVEHIVDAAKKFNSTIVHISSDYIFDGKQGPYAEGDKPSPLSYYGKTKLASENILHTADLPHVIVRTIVLYGYAEGVKPNFALWLLDSLGKGRPVTIVDDQFGNPTLVDDLAYGIMKAVELRKTGVYHLAGRDIVSRYDFALTLARVFALDASLIRPIKTADLRQPAFRPLRSGLVTLKAEVELGYRPSTVEEGLAVFKSQMQRSGRWIADRTPAPGQRSPRSSSR